MEESSPARLYALLAGSVLTILGLAGFFYTAGFETGPELPADDLLGVFAVNGWMNALHLVTGLLGLAAAGYAARAYAAAAGIGYVAIAIWGLTATAPDNGVAVIAHLLPLNTADDVLHLLLGLAGVAAAAATQRAARPAAA